MKLSKEDFYRERAKSYPFEDPEALIRYKRAIKWMDLSQNVSVREVGCKYSVIRDLLRNKNNKIDYIAIDIDQATLEKIPDYHPGQFLQHNANNGLPFEDGCADYLVCLEVLEHLENATYFLNETARILKKDGRAIISVPNPYYWEEMIDNIRRAKDTEGHIGSFTYQNMESLARFCGFHITSVQGTFTRVPFSRRIFPRYKIFQTDNIFLTRSFMFMLTKL